MKLRIIFYLLVLIIFQLSGYSQEWTVSDHLRIRNLMWNSNDPDFSITQSLEKWENEPAVILCRKYEYMVSKEVMMGSIKEYIYSHIRIILQNKSVVEKYSTFTFDVSKTIGSDFDWGSSQNIYLGLKVIKPDGKETEVSIKKEMVDEISNKRESKRYQKVVVPDLEPGDILDYYVATESSILANYLYYGFSPVIYPLVDEYPIQKQKIDMHIMRKCYLSARSMNGAPELKLYDNSKKNDVFWSLVDSNREKAKEQDFVFPLREIPVLIFQAFFTKNLLFNNKYFFVDKEDKLKNSVSDSDLEVYFNWVKNDIMYSGENKIYKFWNKYYKKETNPEILAREAYYFYRETLYASNYKYALANGYNNDYAINDYAFVTVLSRAFRRKNIPHSIVITVPRELGALEDIVIRNQMGYLLKIHNVKPFFLTGFSKNSVTSQIDYSYQGNKTKSLQIFNDYNLISPVIINDSVPVDSMAVNMFTEEMKVSFNPDSADKLLIAQDITASGWEKTYFQYKYISVNDRINEYDKNRYNIKVKKVSNSMALQRLNLAVTNDIIDRDKRVLDHLKENFENENIKNLRCKLIQPGIWEDKPEFKFHYDMEIPDFISQTGDNIILEAGKLIGKQIEYDKTDSIRLYNIYFSYPKSIHYRIRIEIPKGFIVKGLENLSINYVNEAGVFVSAARINGNILEIDVKKQYIKNYLRKEKWPLVQQFIDAAIEFRTKKVMFVKAL